MATITPEILYAVDDFLWHCLIYFFLAKDSLCRLMTSCVVAQGANVSSQKNGEAMSFLNRLNTLTNLSPLVSREMREESRRPLTYWLRVLAAAAMVVVFIGFAISAEIPSSRWGSGLFDVLSRGLIVAVWLIVPAITADCISREKREGTLGLLFLTPLSTLDVMLGKAAVNILRAVTIVLAAVPLIMLPLDLGGVSGLQILHVLTSLATALLLGIAAGLFASAKGGTTTQVIVLAEIYAFLLWLVLGFLAIYAYAFTMVLPPSFRTIVHITEPGIIALIMFAAILKLSVNRLRETWDKDSAGFEQPVWVSEFSNTGMWQWDRSRTRDRNPIAWLQEYSWTARLTKWGWFFSILFVEFVMMIGFPGRQPQLVILFSLGVAFSAAVSFRRERQAGLLEILLVTPISAEKLALGRLWGIFSHFSPALSILCVFWYSDMVLNEKAFHANQFLLVWPNPIAFLALMAVGLYLSLWRANLMVIWLTAWGVAFFLPSFAAKLLYQGTSIKMSTVVILISVVQFCLATGSWVLLQRNLKERRFVVV